jgi:hypothetical protein
MAPKYIFVWDTETDTFPERYRVRKDTDVVEPDDGDALNGTIEDNEADALYADLKQRFPPPRYALDGQHGTRWATIERIYPGMRSVE